VSTIIFHPEVTLEIKASYEWYEGQLAGLGGNYELESAFLAIEQFPDTWPKFEKKFRRYLLSKFPYSVIYHATSNKIYVVAVMHNHRNPGYWLRRA
jgi:toxin ParE1/3/4